MSLSEIIINLIKEMQLNETELEEIHEVIHQIRRKQDSETSECYGEGKRRHPDERGSDHEDRRTSPEDGYP